MATVLLKIICLTFLDISVPRISFELSFSNHHTLIQNHESIILRVYFGVLRISVPKHNSNAHWNVKNRVVEYDDGIFHFDAFFDANGYEQSPELHVAV